MLLGFGTVRDRRIAEEYRKLSRCTLRPTIRVCMFANDDAENGNVPKGAPRMRFALSGGISAPDASFRRRDVTCHCRRGGIR